MTGRFVMMQGVRPHAAKLLSQALFVCMALLLCTCKAQQKSSTVQVIDGKKFYIHTIEKKQSLYAISKLYNVSLDTLYKLNPELRSGAKANQQIRVPMETVTAAPAVDTNKYQTHTVAKGETVYSITRRYAIAEKELYAYNPAVQQNGLREGQVIIVGEKQKRKGRDKAPSAAGTPTALPPLDSAFVKPFSKPPKNLYNVSLLLPFKLSQVGGMDLQTLLRGNDEFPSVPARAADFYLGCRKAADSLAGPGFSVNLQLYDFDEKDTLTLAQLSKDADFMRSDLIIGPLYQAGFSSAAQKAAEMHAPIVSPFTQQNKILFNNIYISKTNPSQYTLLESLADYCQDSLSQNRTNFILMTVSAKDKKEGNYTEAFKAYYNDRVLRLGRPLTDTIRTAKGIDGLKKVFVPGVKNVVVALSTNQVFIADFTTKLAIFAGDNDVVLCGWETVTGMDNIDQEYLNQLHYTFPHQFDATAKSIPALDRYYQQQQFTSPIEYNYNYYYIGFDLAYYYLRNLKEKGPDYIYQLDRLPAEASYMRFKFYHPDHTTGFDNRGVYIFRYRDYRLEKTGWK